MSKRAQLSPICQQLSITRLLQNYFRAIPQIEIINEFRSENPIDLRVQEDL